MKLIKKSKKLNNVLYDIRGPIVDRAKEMEAQGQQLIKLNIGNLASFDFQVPEEIQRDMILNLPNSAGYSDSKGIFAARKAVMHYTQELGIRGVTLDDIYLGNGASDLISLATNALLDEGDELLIPMPDYPLWTATTSLSGGTPVHYLCDEENGWQPDLDDIRAKITPRTRGIVIINPNNPTGRRLSEGDASQARRHRPRVRPHHLRRRGLRQDPLRGCEAHRHREPLHRRPHDHVQFALQGLPRLRLPCGLDDHLGQQAARPRLH